MEYKQKLLKLDMLTTNTLLDEQKNFICCRRYMFYNTSRNCGNTCCVSDYKIEKVTLNLAKKLGEKEKRLLVTKASDKMND